MKHVSSIIGSPEPGDAVANAEPGDRLDGVVIGRVVQLAPGSCRVEHPFGLPDQSTIARLLIDPASLAIGDQVALLFENGNRNRPIVMGRMQTQIGDAPLDQTVDVEALVIGHPQHLILKCGKASISLSADGRIHLNGEYLLSVSKGVNRIAGASVKIN